jgi:cytochrome c556
MAKPRTAPSALDQVRTLLTAAENKVLASSMGATIAKATREQVDAAMKRARVLRDKWRDLHASQARSTKRTPKAGSAVNERTKAKHDVFDGAVKRLEARLAELTAGVKAAVGGQAARLSAATKPTKAARTKAARGGRASVRHELKSAVAEMNTTRTKATPKPAAKRAAAAAAPAVAPKPAVVAKAAASKKRKKPVAPLAAVAQRGLAFDAAKQRSAKAKSTTARLKFDGATTRRAGNALASTKRAQARRDGRRR